MEAKDFLVNNIYSIISKLRAALPSRATDFNDLEANVRGLVSLASKNGASVPGLNWIPARKYEGGKLYEAVVDYLKWKKGKASLPEIVEVFYRNDVRRGNFAEEDEVLPKGSKKKRWKEENVRSATGQSLKYLINNHVIHSNLDSAEPITGACEISDDDLFWLPEYAEEQPKE